MSSNNNQGYAYINKMIDRVIQGADMTTYSTNFGILFNILIEMIVTPAFETYKHLCETLFYNNYGYVNTLLEGSNIVGGEEDAETIRLVVSLIKEEILEEGGVIDNKKIVEGLIVYYYD